MKPTIVTGGAGFIGGHLVDRLVARGEAVRVVERPGASTDHLPPEIEVVRADIRDAGAVREALAGAGSVYHLAANPNLWARDRREFDAVNHQGTRHVLTSALDHGAGRIVHVSTESILTRAKQSGPITEEVEITLKDAVGPYCRSKLRAEEFARELARGGAPVLLVNPTMPVGPGDRGISPPTRLVRDFARGQIPAAMECTLNLIDVRDIAEGLVRVHDRGRPGRRYLLGGEDWSLTRLFGALSELTGVPAPKWRVPYPAGLLAAVVSEWWADRVTGRMPQATITGVRLTRRAMAFDASRSLEELDLRPRSVRAALAEALDWMRGQGWLPASGGKSRENGPPVP